MGQEKNITLQNRYCLRLGLSSALFLCVFLAEVLCLRLVALMLVNVHGVKDVGQAEIHTGDH